MLKESDILLKMAKDKPTATRKLINFFKNVIEKIRKLLAKNSKVETEEFRALKSAADDMQSIVDKWEKAVIAGIKNQNAKVYAENGQKNSTADGSNVEYSIRNTKNTEWSKQINDYYSNGGIIKHSDTLVIERNTPGYLLSNISNLPLALPIRVITKAQSGKDISHSITNDNIRNLQSGIHNAIATIYDENRNSLFVITDIKQNEYPLVISFDLNSKFDGDLVHKCTSIHLRTNLNAYLSKLYDATIYVKNKNELTALCREVNILDRLQNSNKLIDVSLSQSNDNVKCQPRSSELDSKYLEAVKNNDLETAQRFVDEAAKANGYNIKAYHGTTNQQGVSTWNPEHGWYDTEYKNFTVFKKQYDEQTGHFFNDDIDNAGGYGSILYSVYLKINKPLVIDCNGQNYAKIKFDGKEMDTYEWAEYAKENRYDGVIFKNISDGVDYADLSRLTTDYVVFNSNQIKSSEPVTHDDKGNVIPLSKRFINYSVDIRYQARVNPDYNFHKALNKEERGRFESALKNNSRGLLIGDNGVLLVDYENTDNYKLICYNGDKLFPEIQSVYKIEGFDYNIHNLRSYIIDLIVKLEKEKLNGKSDSKTAKTILQDLPLFIGETFKIYNRKTCRYNTLVRGKLENPDINRKDDRQKPNRTGVSENAGGSVPDGINQNAKVYAENGQKNSTADGSNVEYSIRKTQNMSYLEQLELIETRKLNGSNSLYIGIPSDKLTQAGFSKNPFAMNQKDYRKSRRSTANNKHYSKHDVPIDFFKVLPQKLNNCVMFIDNGTKVTAITDFEMQDTKGNKSFIVAGLWQNQKMESDIVNLVKSAYPLDDISQRIISNSESGKLIVLNKSKAKNMLATIGIQPSEVSRILNLAKVSLSQSNDNVKYQTRSAELDSKYLEAVKNNDLETAQKLVDEAAKANGYNIKAYHGTARADRVGNVFLPKRATSGPMAFFTDDEEIAKNYSRDKQDTSIAYDDEYTDYHTQFRVINNGKSIPVSELWKTLSHFQKQELKEKAKHITFDYDAENIIYDNETDYGVGTFDDYALHMHNGNVIDTLIENWLDDGNLIYEEEKFLDVLKLLGIDGVEYKNPNARFEKVYSVYLHISNAFDTDKNYNQKFITDISDWAQNTDTSKYQQETAYADMWDKNNISIEDWIEKAKMDISDRTTHAWTSIPDAVTAYIKMQGYDGIKDTGGKNGGDKDNVYIPFASEQIKSADPVTYDDNGNVIPISERFKDDKSDIRYQARDNRPDYYFHKALSTKEWASFYASVTNSNQRDSLRIGDNGILIPDENNPYNYKLVCYDGDSISPMVTAVYKLENYDYTIHDKKADVTKIITRLEKDGYNAKQARTVLQDYTSLYGSLFKRYNNKSGRFVKLTRESVSTRKDDRREPNRRGVSENAERSVPDGINEERYQQRGYSLSDDELIANADMEVNNVPDFGSVSTTLLPKNVPQAHFLNGRLQIPWSNF